MSEAALALLQGRKILALTGAGCSTDSGIPDYRGEESIKKARNPVQYKQFMQEERSRQRYWARSFVGWPRFQQAQPNATHDALSKLEQAGHLTGIITQNVDRLHHQAGSRAVVELHGALAEVICLGCGALSGRAALQQRLEALNPNYAQWATEAPDGDAEVEDTTAFNVASCERCQGILKPHVVFFGENVPEARVISARQMLLESEVLLVLGTSLTVYSGYRFVRYAREQQLPVVVINRGPTRADAELTLKLDQGVAESLLPLMAALLG